MTGYPLPKGQLAEVACAVLTLQPRSFAAEARRATAALRPPALYECTEYIPARGPFLAVHNHFNAPGYAAWWNVLSISAAVSSRRAVDADHEIHWIMTAALRGSNDGWRDRTLERATRWAFARVARIYGFINMPPMPPRPGEEAERARSVLQAVRLARRLARSGGMVGLTPEGQDNPGGLGPPPPGAGEFIALLVEAGLPVLPCGNSQRGDQLHVRFGPVFVPEIPPRKSDRDAIVADQVMGAIRSCLEA